MVSAKDKNKYGIKSTTPGFPELELALHIAAKKIGWKSLTCHVVKWTKANQPDTAYDLQYWLDQIRKP